VGLARKREGGKVSRLAAGLRKAKGSAVLPVEGGSKQRKRGLHFEENISQIYQGGGKSAHIEQEKYTKKILISI